MPHFNMNAVGASENLGYVLVAYEAFRMRLQQAYGELK